ncbi:uncharacterized protein LOC119454467 [Dermacentor silvarum]|uniref:uncharacterized protein LOC119454467 n=1 Tax=Dermacentor silvarum TaxID=543639 RepID=UPI00210071E5|nr:uncharacterized protein LOC119454467 [Dermacentor silvarum]
MEDLYTEQRTFINTEPFPHTLTVKEEWPLLFVRPFFYGHADKLLGKNVKAIFQEKMLICAPQVMHLMELTPRKETMRVVVHVHDVENENHKAVQVALLPLLCAHFKDDEKCLFQVFEEGTSLVGELGHLPSTPTIVVLGSIFKQQCYIAVEQQLLFNENVDFVEATCLLFLAYYVFNMSYADGAATTLEFLQRCEIFLCNIH